MSQAHVSLFGCRPFLAGQGLVEPTERGLRLALPSATTQAYSDAQIDDYAGLPRRRFPWRPPLHMTIQARFSPGQAAGTAGFGLWNNPFSPLALHCRGGQFVRRETWVNTHAWSQQVSSFLAGGLPALPRAAWFFYASESSDMALAEGIAGHGWKAAVIDATRAAALAWAPLAPVVLLLNQIPAFRRRLWPRVQRALCISEARLDLPMAQWHEYQLVWQAARVTFSVDGTPVLQTDCAPRGPMGFVAWMDNQYAVATSRARLGWGLLDVSSPQWLEIADLRHLHLR